MPIHTEIVVYPYAKTPTKNFGRSVNLKSANQEAIPQIAYSIKDDINKEVLASTPIGEFNPLPLVIIRNVFEESITLEEILKSTALANALAETYDAKVHVLAEIRGSAYFPVNILEVAKKSSEVKKLMDRDRIATVGYIGLNKAMEFVIQAYAIITRSEIKKFDSWDAGLTFFISRTISEEENARQQSPSSDETEA